MTYAHSYKEHSPTHIAFCKIMAKVSQAEQALADIYIVIDELRDKLEEEK